MARGWDKASDESEVNSESNVEADAGSLDLAEAGAIEFDSNVEVDVGSSDIVEVAKSEFASDVGLASSGFVANGAPKT
jgi:hypothetical protein